jgi:hypothetical protein
MTVFWICYAIANIVAFFVIAYFVLAYIDEKEGVVWLYPWLHKTLGLNEVNFVGKIVLYLLLHLFILPAIIAYFITLACVILGVSIWILGVICFMKKR